jgi:hypothetical protein
MPSLTRLVDSVVGALRNACIAVDTIIRDLDSHKSVLFMLILVAG